MQVVEIYVIVHLSCNRVRVTNSITLIPKASVLESSDAAFSLKPSAASLGTDSTPTIVALSSQVCVMTDLDDVVLLQGDLCVLSVLIACPGLNLNDDLLLQWVSWLNVQCKIDEVQKPVNVHAVCKDHHN
ncbi:unnamed protein product [Peronospora belbahrii]|uniref:Uncharacterized protein n=1 Tax=Peronospora belbahrii TaxID=622444 RepID=A0ABN8D2W2_9STRA|nr:unnamed protein product [Peronospora belbahrii]